MSATDELRRLLDERGVEWTAPNSILRDMMTCWTAGGFYYEAFEVPEPDGTFLLTAAHQDDLTPEQAIAAALGGGECELHECEGSFSALNRPVWRCDCGAFMTQYTDATTYHKPRFCPNCGRKAVKR